MAQRTRSQRLNGLFPLSYMGVVPVSPVNFIIDDRDPTVSDSKNFYIGDLWLNTSTRPPDVADLWMLVDLSGNVATWVNFGAGDLETLTGDTGGPVAPDGAGNINILSAIVGLTVDGNPGTNTLTLNSSQGGGLLQTLTGNSGGPVFPDGAGNINVVGDTTTITVAGNPGTNTLTVSAVGTGLISTLTGDIGGAVPPTAGNINLLGTAGRIVTTGNPGTSTIVWDVGDDVATSYITNPATGIAIPAAGVLTFAGTGGIVVSAAGSTVTIDGSGVAGTVTGLLAQDGNTVTPTAGVIQVSGSNNIYTTGTAGPNTLTINPPGSRSAFMVVFDTENNITGDNTIALLGATAAGTALYDIGGDVDLGGGGTPVTFTAPYDGVYLFATSILFVAGGAGTGGVQVSVNFVVTSGGVSYYSVGTLPSENQVANFYSFNKAIGFSGTIVVPLNAADTVQCSLLSGQAAGGLAKVDGTLGGGGIGTTINSHVSGILLA